MLLAEFDSEGENVKHQYVGDINDCNRPVVTAENSP